jgi:hypothetical protein
MAASVPKSVDGQGFSGRMTVLSVFDFVAAEDYVRPGATGLLTAMVPSAEILGVPSMTNRIGRFPAAARRRHVGALGLAAGVMPKACHACFAPSE